MPPELDPDIAILLEQAYMSVLDDLPTWHVRQRMKALTAQWMHLPPDYPDFDAPAHPAVARPYNRLHCIDSAYNTMAIEEEFPPTSCSTTIGYYWALFHGAPLLGQEARL